MFICFSFIIIFLISLGFQGFLFNRENLILSLLFLEIILLGILLNFSLMGFLINNINEIWISILVIIISVSESALGLIIIVYLFKLKETVSVKNMFLLKN